MLQVQINQATGLIKGINKLVRELSATIDSQATAVDRSSAATVKMLNSIKDNSEISRNKQKAIKNLTENAARGQESMRGTIQSVEGISQLVDGIAQAIKIISSIAANTNLRSMNAAIEAAHAGEAGRGFAVVAGEIRRLSESTRENSLNISRTLKNIIDGIAVASKQSDDTGSRITEMSREIDSFAETMTSLITTFSEMWSQSGEITSAMDSLRSQSNTVKTDYNDILSMTEKLSSAMHNLSELADKTQKA
jgi:methyl-accepting chemotaxis protein